MSSLPESASARPRRGLARVLLAANVVVCVGMFAFAATSRNAIFRRLFDRGAWNLVGAGYNWLLLVLGGVVAVQALALRSESRWYTVLSVVAAVLAVVSLCMILTYPRPAMLG